MKRASNRKILIYLLPALLLCLNSCIKTQRDPDKYLGDKGYPLGTFAGECMRLRKNAYNYKIDTARVNLTLVLSTNTGYRLTGDTTTWHAGSYGSFSEDFVNMIFNDASLSPYYASKKVRLLSGLYTYDYAGNTLVISPGGVQSDTLRYIYTLKKIK
jgi:hypothetical protein